MPSPHAKHAESVAAKLAAKAAKHQIKAEKYRDDIDGIMADPAITRLFDLAELADEAARAEGSERLKLTLVTVAALAEHFRSMPGALPDLVADRVEAAVTYALTGQMPTP